MRDLIVTMAGPSTSRDNGTDERREEIVHVGFGGCPARKYRLISHFTRMFCNVYGPQFETAEPDVMSAFENIFDIAFVQLTVDVTNRYAQQEISKSIRPLIFHSTIRKWEDVTNFTICLHRFGPISCPLVSFLKTLCLLVVCHDVSDLLLDGVIHLTPYGFYCGFHFSRLVFLPSSILETGKPISLSMSFIFFFHFL
jgi:hypothetical protein